MDKQKQLRELLDREFLSRQEAIDYLDISKQCFHSLVARGKITKIKKGSAVLFYRYEIEHRKNIAPELFEKYRPYQR
ncbi:helix-turn-helix domain-containing protein [Listeria booriae]|uniref:Helix-turn-helix domain-containing protein n=1 Tax=Listeria booriae TaxID=1552123 RepID=A0A7X1D5Z8_9LIST|nr:helix-turn-helix domain-containing protein [Listeria booriae]MBC1893170.1 helix-turn-helix domain-containing protein [Listeria booriae]MBC1912020.1 helix-turn-helix domain-containing protein [Listeria booriae]MBC1920218.1 helix-turn-helix domain-containing protein [Listeria booriae]MBC1973679.1 helix-turn-helix domain-containing protein [Listeria booriae]MBC1983221.1 helix-turn-helix domain-containing protein [Listeria booriae]